MSFWDQLFDSVEQKVESKQAASPLELAMSIEPTFNSRPHLEYLSSRLTKAVADVHAGQNRYLTTSMPPRMGKSTIASTMTPTFILANHPTWKIGLISHSPTLAGSWGRQIRRLAESHPELGIEIAKDAGAVTGWETTMGGGVWSMSVGQSPTGLGFNVLMMDDVVKDFAAAHSAVNREAVWNWWLANSRTRMEAPYLVVAIGTRWHQDDYIGRLLSSEHEGDPEQWERISLPAIATRGDVLGRKEGDPLYSPLADQTREQALATWEETRRAVGSYAWNALYQQDPVPSQGEIFNIDWWQYYDQLPDRFDRVLTSWDMAFKATNSSDYVVGQRWGVVGADKYLIEQVRGRWTFTQTVQQVREFAGDTREHLVEDKANGTAVIDTLKRELPGVIPVNPTESKEARARSVTPDVEAGNVYLPAGVPWLDDYLSEMRAFPSGPHDDQVDCTTQALARLRMAGKGRARVSTLAQHRHLPG